MLRMDVVVAEADSGGRRHRRGRVLQVVLVVKPVSVVWHPAEAVGPAAPGPRRPPGGPPAPRSRRTVAAGRGGGGSVGVRESVGPPICLAPLGLPDVAVPQLNAERVVPHERGPVLVNLALVEPPDLTGGGERSFFVKKGGGESLFRIKNGFLFTLSCCWVFSVLFCYFFLGRVESRRLKAKHTLLLENGPLDDDEIGSILFLSLYFWKKNYALSRLAR